MFTMLLGSSRPMMACPSRTAETTGPTPGMSNVSMASLQRQRAAATDRQKKQKQHARRQRAAPTHHRLAAADSVAVDGGSAAGAALVAAGATDSIFDWLHLVVRGQSPERATAFRCPPTLFFLCSAHTHTLVHSHLQLEHFLPCTLFENKSALSFDPKKNTLSDHYLPASHCCNRVSDRGTGSAPSCSCCIWAPLAKIFDRPTKIPWGRPCG